MSAVVRRMRSEDYSAVADIWVRSGLPYQPRGRDSEERVREQMERGSSIFLVAEDKAGSSAWCWSPMICARDG